MTTPTPFANPHTLLRWYNSPQHPQETAVLSVRTWRICADLSHFDDPTTVTLDDVNNALPDDQDIQIVPPEQCYVSLSELTEDFQRQFLPRELNYNQNRALLAYTQGNAYYCGRRRHKSERNEKFWALAVHPTQEEVDARFIGL